MTWLKIKYKVFYFLSKLPGNAHYIFEAKFVETLLKIRYLEE